MEREPKDIKVSICPECGNGIRVMIEHTTTTEGKAKFTEEIEKYGLATKTFSLEEWQNSNIQLDCAADCSRKQKNNKAAPKMGDYQELAKEALAIFKANGMLDAGLMFRSSALRDLDGGAIMLCPPESRRVVGSLTVELIPAVRVRVTEAEGAADCSENRKNR